MVDYGYCQGPYCDEYRVKGRKEYRMALGGNWILAHCEFCAATLLTEDFGIGERRGGNGRWFREW